MRRLCTPVAGDFGHGQPPVLHQVASIYATITFITFRFFRYWSLVRLDMEYLATSIIFISSVVPLFSPFIVLLLMCGCMSLPFWFGDGPMSLVTPIIIYTVEYSAFMLFSDKIYSDFERKGRCASPLLTAFSMGLGVAAFGWKVGVTLMPLLLCSSRCPPPYARCPTAHAWCCRL